MNDHGIYTQSSPRGIRQKLEHFKDTQEKLKNKITAKVSEALHDLAKKDLVDVKT